MLPHEIDAHRALQRRALRLAVLHLAERDVPVGREFSRHAENAFADDVALHLRATPCEFDALTAKVSTPVLAAEMLLFGPDAGSGTSDLKSDIRAAYADASGHQPGQCAGRR